MNGLRGDNVVLDVLEKDKTWIYGLDKRLEDRQAWVSRSKKRLDMTANRNDDNNRNISKPSIFRIPASIRKVDPDKYEPDVLSLGPYHHGKLRLQAMDELKWCYFERFLRRNPEEDLDDYLRLVEELESQARGAYSELESPVDSKEFVQMMLLDCCFLLELLLKYHASKKQGGGEGGRREGGGGCGCGGGGGGCWCGGGGDGGCWCCGGGEEEGKEEDEMMDPIRNSAWAMPFVLRDILLLENQLPFFLLERLLDLNIPHKTPSFPQIILDSFWDVMPGKIRKTLTDSSDIHHILHLVYSCAIPKSVREDNPKSSSPASLSCLYKMLPRGKSRLRRQVQNHNPGGRADGRVTSEEPTPHWIPSAKNLREAGVKIKKKTNYESFLQVSFDKGVMEIPRLQILGYIDSVLLNLIAFEQCHTSINSPLYVSTYAYLMDRVVDTAADVQLLKDKGIIVSTLGNDEDVALLFNRLPKNSSIDDSCLASVFNSIKIHCDKGTNKSRAFLNHNYLYNRWARISFGAAILLFVLTITQPALAFFSYLDKSRVN